MCVMCWRIRLFIEGIRTQAFTCGKCGKQINHQDKGVRPRPLTYSKGGELKGINIKLRVFDQGRLLVVRVGNLKKLIIKLRVFDPGRLLVVRVWNLND